ncbi:hypothetical protein JOC75_003725 [Metabacillus crassostreae]|nr:hypothetical protein [Metabacillus crassostreae]
MIKVKARFKCAFTFFYLSSCELLKFANEGVKALKEVSGHSKMRAWLVSIGEWSINWA